MYVISLRLKKDTWNTNNLCMKYRFIHGMHVITLRPEKRRIEHTSNLCMKKKYSFKESDTCDVFVTQKVTLRTHTICAHRQEIYMRVMWLLCDSKRSSKKPWTIYAWRKKISMWCMWLLFDSKWRPKKAISMLSMWFPCDWKRMLETPTICAWSIDLSMECMWISCDQKKDV